MKQLGLAVANYHAANGHYPTAFVADENGVPIHSWRVVLLPYLEIQDLYDRYDFTQPWNSEANLKLEREMPSVYAFHGDYQPGTVTTNYLAIVGEETAWPGASPRKTEEVTDHNSATIMLVENAGEDVHWMEPRDLQADAMSLVVNDPKGVSSKYLAPAVVMLDGSLRRLEDDLPANVLRAMLTVNGGERIDSTGSEWQLLPDGRTRKRRGVNAE
ncbi:MAG: DUF1559 domain-containing protein [Planctomycetota bacterium]